MVKNKKITLTKLFKSGNYNTDKYDLGYLEHFYDDFFIKIKKKSSITMMEIGVSYGGSIQLWRDYLDTNNKIYAGDVTYFQPVENTYSIIGDMYSDDQVSKFSDNYFDLIIDDGPHSFESFTLLIEKYFLKIKKDGKLIVEDIIHSEWVEPLVKLAESVGYSNVEILNMMGKQNTEELLDRWKNGLYILNITK